MVMPIRLLAHPTEQVPSPICIDTVSNIFERLNAVLDSDGGALWGVNLHGPVVIADAATRYAIANMPDVDGDIFTKHDSLYVGQLPEGTLIGLTASYFGGMLWGMITWGFVRLMAVISV